MKRHLFFWAALLSILAIAPLGAIASPMLGHVGPAEVTLSLSPDPPQPGAEHATVLIRGVASDKLANTTVTYVSQMPSMTMKGSTGSARAILG